MSDSDATLPPPGYEWDDSECFIVQSQTDAIKMKRRSTSEHAERQSPDSKAKKDADRRTRNRAAVEAYRQRLKEDPVRYQELKEQNRRRTQKNRQESKSSEQKERERLLHRQRQARYAARKKAEMAAKADKPARETRQDKAKAEQRRERVRLAVQKHRANQHPNKKRRVKEKRREYYYRMKNEKIESLKAKTEKAVQAEQDFQASGCPYQSRDAYLQAVRRAMKKIGAKGAKLSYLLKGLAQTSDRQTRQTLKELDIHSTSDKHTHTPLSTPSKVLQSHIKELGRKRDRTNLTVKRNLANAFRNMPRPGRVGLTKRFLTRSSEKKNIYDSQGSNHKDDIEDFYQTHSMAIPCKSAKNKRQLSKSVSELYREFKRKHNSNISLRTFYRLKPKSMMSVTKLKFRQCLCEICLNPKAKLVRLNLLLTNKCESIKELLDESMCVYEGDFPKTECVNRQCADCGVDKVRARFENELDHLTDNIRWGKWELVKEGKKSRMEKVSKNGSVRECVKELMSELGPLARHVFIAEWQRNQLQELKKNLPEDWAIVTMDFAENFLCKFQDEPQSAHWSYRQVTVFPVVVHTRCTSCTELRRDCLVFLSDELRHDAFISQMFITKALDYISQLRKMEKIILVSDGCAAQFKSKLPFFFLTKTQIPGSESTSVEKCFFGSRHGKNDSDWCGGAVKRNALRDIAAGRVCIKGAHDMYEHCAKTMSFAEGLGSCIHKVQRFFLVDQKEVRREMDSNMIKTVPGSRKIHHVRVLSDGVLATRELACFCAPCRADDWSSCLSSKFVDNWKEEKMKFSGSLPSCSVSGDGDRPVEQTPDFQSDSFEDLESRSSVGNADACPDDRISLFDSIAADLRKCRNLQEIKVIAERMETSVGNFPLPFPSTLSVGEHDVDTNARSLLDPNFQEQCFPLIVEGDGNCFFRSLSVLLFDTENHHEELRCRIAMAMASNPDIFLDGSKWCADHDVVTPESIIQVALLTSAARNLSPPDALEQEILTSVQDATYTGLWVFFGAAYVIRCPILSVFPPLGWDLYRSHCNRVIRPPNCRSDKKLFIMWSSTREDQRAEHWVPNHFVPVVLARAEQENGPQIGAFYMVQWQGREYLAVVHETDEICEVACVLFYEQKKGTQLFSFPARPDFSWEPFQAFKRKVSLRMDENASSHRCQFFTIS